MMKEPAMLWCGANTVITVGGFIWLYQTNVKLANQVSELTQIVNMLNEQNKSSPETFKKIDEALTKLNMGVHTVAFQLGQHQDYLNYLNECNESLVVEVKKTSDGLTMPRKPSKVKKLMTMIKKKKKEEDSDEDSSDSSSSSSDEEEDPIEILRKKREAKRKAKKKNK